MKLKSEQVKEDVDKRLAELEKYASTDEDVLKLQHGLSDYLQINKKIVAVFETLHQKGEAMTTEEIDAVYNTMADLEEEVAKQGEVLSDIQKEYAQKHGITLTEL